MQEKVTTKHTETYQSEKWLLTQTGMVESPDVTGPQTILIWSQVVTLDTVKGEEDVTRAAATPVPPRSVGAEVITASRVVHTLVNVCQQNGSLYT